MSANVPEKHTAAIYMVESSHIGKVAGNVGDGKELLRIRYGGVEKNYWAPRASGNRKPLERQLLQYMRKSKKEPFYRPQKKE